MPRRTSAAAAAFCLLLAAAVHSSGGQAQPPRDPRDKQPQPAGTAAVTGVVVVPEAGLPARKARVNLSGGELRAGRTVLTDDQGRFAFLHLPAGRYSLTASKGGHVAVTYGQRQPGSGRPGTPIELTDGQKLEARLLLPKGGVITGTVLDEIGEPTPGTQVRVLRYVTQSGVRTLQNSNSASTDDRGLFRVYGLQPGEYAVCATPRNMLINEGDRLAAELSSARELLAEVRGRDPGLTAELERRTTALQAEVGQPREDQPVSGYAPVCYPGTTFVAQAAPVAIGVSEERAGVDFQLQLVPLARVEGLVLNPSGAQLQNLQVSLVSTADVPGIGNSSARPDPEGRFRIPNVAPGQYKLVARATVRQPPGPPPPQNTAQGRAVAAARAGDAPRFFALADVSVDGRNVPNVMLTLQPGITVSGQLVLEATTQQLPQDLSRVRVNLAPVASPSFLRDLGGGATGRVDAVGRFTISNVMPGRYRLGGSAGSGWMLESAVLGGQDTADFPIDIKGDQNITGATLTFTDRQNELSGTVIDDRNQPATAYTVIVYPVDQRYWGTATRRIQSARPATDGRFTFRSLPAGDYRLATVIDPEPGTWQEPAFLQQLDATSLRITIAPGEKKVQNLRVPAS